MADTRWITLDPAHFHAALVHKEMKAGVDPVVHVYAPLGPDLALHVNRIAGFNSRGKDPTHWSLEIHAGADYLPRMLTERPGNVVVLSGRNRGKIDYLLAAVEAGFHVLADKPWILVPDDLPKLQRVLDLADSKSLIASDIMTERFEVTSILQRRLVNDPDVFGSILAGSAEQPAVSMGSLHYLCKSVAGVPNRRPPAFFDIHEQGEGLSDVGTHLVDLVQWMLFPDQAIDAAMELQVLSAKRWPRVLTRTDFQRVTGEADFPPALKAQLQSNCLLYYCNNRVSYTIRGIHVALNVLWDFAATAGSGDTQVAVIRGSKALVEVRQGPDENFIPELYVIPVRAADRADVSSAVRARIAALQAGFHGVEVQDYRDGVWIRIPDEFRVGHEAHFGQVVDWFLHYVHSPRSLPSWERPNMLAKYHVTTQGVAMARA